MVHVQCMDPRTSENYNFSYCPSFPAAVLFSALFALTLFAHLFQAMYYCKRFCWIIIMAGIWETAGLVLRVFAILHTTSEAFGVPSQLLILLSPLWINAFFYVVMARLIYFFVPEKRIAGIRAQRLSLVFVLLDITAFLVQVAGGVLINPSNSAKLQLLAIHIYMGGIGIQQFFVCGFTALVVCFHRRMRALDGSTEWKRPLYTMYASIVLITIRIIFRLIEFSAGVFSPITMHEAPFYVTEALPMFLVLLAWNISHPGQVLVGPDSEFPKKAKKGKSEKDEYALRLLESQTPTREY